MTHSWTEKAFTRTRRLTFPFTLLLILRNSVKSLQNVVNEAMMLLGETPVTASAYCQARYKIKHTAFIALNQKAVIQTMYADDDYQKFWGFRILAVDGSKIVLPDNQDVRNEFGTLKWSKKCDTGVIKGEKPFAIASVLYDVLNRVALDAQLAKAKAYEVDLAVEHLAHTNENDLLVMDRGYTSYRMLAELTKHQRNFVIRCGAASFKTAQDMLKGKGADSQIVTLVPCKNQAKIIENSALPKTINVRFVRVLLDTGEYEVLVTSLLDEERYATKTFSDLYWFRWRIETFYGLLKTRLELENFTGTGVEAIRQDFYGAVFLTGLESILTDTAQAQLDAKLGNQFTQMVNRAVSFNAIKNQAFALLWSDLQTETLLEKLTLLFRGSPTSVRPNRKNARTKFSPTKILNFHKRQKKHGF